MNKKLFMLWTFLLCFLGGISAAEVTIDFSAQGYENAQLLTTVEQDGVTYTFDQGTGSTAPAYYNTGYAARVYAGGSLTVSAAKTITGIAFTFGSGDGTNEITVDAGSYADGTWTGSATSVKFSVGGTSKHRRIQKITVTLDESEAAVKTPVLTPAGGSYLGTQSVTISCETADAKIYYTLDGNDPTAESAEYTAPVEITETATLKAIAIKGEDKSSIAAAKYTILANIANTVDAPMTVAEALAAIANNSAETLAHADNKVYVKGIVKYIDEISTSFGNATYSIVDAEGDADTLLIYRGKFLENAKFTADDSAKFVPGSTVVIYGNLINYNGTTPEMTAGNYLASFEEPKAEEATWKDIKVDFTNDKILTATETNIISVGIKMNEDGTVTRVAADDASANAVVTGKYHSAQHGLANFSATVKVEGPVKIGMGTCAWGGNVTIKDENGAEVANAFNTNNGACWATANGAETNVIYTYYKGEAATLTIAGGSYTPYFSVEKIALEDIPQIMKVNYSLGETGATGILPANFEINDGEKFTTPVNRTLYAEGKTLTGWTDGTNNYTIGQEITSVADTEMTLVPVFTANNVTLDDRKDAVSIVWDFQQKNGAPVVGVQGKTMIWVAQAVVNGETIDVKMDIDATGGKVANGNWTDWAQINGGTKLTIPACKGIVIDLESYSATTNTTIAGDVINQGTTTPTYTYNGEETTIDIVIGDGSYWRTVKATIPVVVKEEPVATWKDIKIDAVSHLTAEEKAVEQAIYSYGVVVAEDGTVSRVAADDPKANAVLTGKYWNSHGFVDLSVTAAVEGAVKIGTGNCSYANNTVKVTDANGAEVATWTVGGDLNGNSEFDDCWTEQGKTDAHVVFGYYTGEATTLTVSVNSYCPYISIEKLDTTAVDITVDVTEGDIAAAVDAEKSKVYKAGNITVNLKEGVEYTLSSAIVAGAGGVAINGNNSVINASAELVSLPAEPLVAANDAKAGFYEISTPITIENVKVKTAKPIVKSNAKYLVSAVNVNNSIVELTGSTPIFDFSGQSGYPTVLSVKNSTFWSATSTNKPFFTSQSGHSPKDINGGAEETQTISIENSDIYNIATSKNFNELRQKGQKFLIFTIKNNIIINSGKDNFLQGIDGGQNSANPIWTVENNTFGKLAEGVFTDISAAQTGCGEVTNSITTDPMFADAANGDFTVFVGSQQAKFQTGDPRWLVEYDATQAFALPIVVDVVEGDILAAVDSVKATVDKVGDITINLAKGTTYTVSNSVLAPANLVINGDSAIIDATALAAPMIITDTVALAEWKTIETIAVNNVVVKGLGAALFQSSGKNLNITNFVVDNSIVEVAKDVTVFDFTKGSVAMNFTVKNSTLYAPTATTKSLYSSQTAQKGSEAGATAEAPQTFSFENTTLYNLTTNKNFFTHRQNNQTWLKYVAKNNVVVNCGKTNFMTSINAGGDSANPQYDVTTNSVGTLADGTYTDLSASQMVQSVVMGTLVTTDPQFKDAAAADFTVYAGSDQAKEKIGDPRWLVEFDETLSGIEGITTDGSSVNGANNDAWYNLQGVRVNGKPTQKGIYIHNGKKIVVK